LQRAVYFYFHTDSLPENTAGSQPRFRGASPAPNNSVKNYMSAKITARAVGFTPIR